MAWRERALAVRSIQEPLRRWFSHRAVPSSRAYARAHELSGAIAVCRLFAPSDSGPYHMAVGLRVPTLAIFRWPSPEHYHHDAWVECLVAGGVEALPSLLEAAGRLMGASSPHHPGAPHMPTDP